MSNNAQTEFRIRNDGYWWAPTQDPQEDLDYYVSFEELLDLDETIIEIVFVTASNAFAYGQTILPGEKGVYVRLKDGVNKKTCEVDICVQGTVNRYNRRFKVDIAQL